jgi:phenylalanyl-tRNA synthetase alpha chain
MHHDLTWSATQLRRLKELQATPAQIKLRFESESDRNRSFQEISDTLGREAKNRLLEIQKKKLRPRLCRLENGLVETLRAEGFVQVTTPVIMSKTHLARMGITADHSFSSQVFWIDGKRCLRPMLAPHLYCLLQNLLRLWVKPVRIFEVGPCFRKESGGAHHAAEFTMLNLVEAGLPLEGRVERIRELAVCIAEAAKLSDYRLETTHSEVYGESIDILGGANNLEVGSSAMGPHVLDRPWHITDAWVGIGFGLERLVMAAEGSESLARLGRSLSYLDGIRLNI